MTTNNPTFPPAVASPGGSGGGSSVSLSWRATVFNFAKVLYPSLGADFMVDFDRGTGGDYASTNLSGTASQTINTTSGQGGIISLATGTTSGSIAGVAPTGNPALITNQKATTWFFAGRAKFGAGNATSDARLGITTVTAGANSVLIGCRGVSDTTHITLYSLGAGAAPAVSAVLLDNTAYHDYAIGFDGTTIAAYYGDFMAGTVSQTPIATVTDLSQMTTGAGMPWALVLNGDTTNHTLDVDKIYLAYPLA